ncbi:MAG: helix-turn-helix domain-containing protein [Pseudomonadales bacterium]
MAKIRFLAYPRVMATSIALPAEMFAAANDIARSRSRRELILDVGIASVGDVVIGTSGGIKLEPTIQFADLASTDLLILPSLWRNPRRTIARYLEIPELLKRLNDRGTIICGIGAASAWLAEAGLLDGKPATTHWHYMDTFAQLYPAVMLQREHMTTKAGNIYCAGSINSGADLTTHFIERFMGPEIARLVEAQFSPEIRQPFQRHGYIQGEINLHADESIAQAQEWLHSNYNQNIHIRDLCQQLGYSQRTLNRRFLTATGQSPGQYLMRIRLDHAKDLLGSSNLSVTEVAQAVGFSDLSNFSSVFKRELGYPPSEYRAQVRSKLFSVGS